MELWNPNASAWTVEDYLRRFRCRALTNQRINDDLTEVQRTVLGEEAARFADPVATLRTGARALEDFEDLELIEAREQINVRDAVVDTAQDEAWKIVGLRQSVLAAAGQSREKVFRTTRIGSIKIASREVTVATAAEVARNLRALPEFEERDRLATRLEQRGAAMADDVKALGLVETRYADKRAELQRFMDVQRVEIVKTYGRLLTVLPKSFVETLFPRPRRSRSETPAATSPTE